MLKFKISVQLVVPATQDKHESNWLVPPEPPHTTILPPERRERLWRDLGWGRSGMEQASEEERGNNSTEERESPSKPPTIN